MAKKEMNLTVDTMQQSYSTIGTFKQLDSVFFNVQITENGFAKDLTELSIKLFAKRADKELIEQRYGINILNAKEGKITIDLKNTIFNHIGIVVCELELSKNTKVISTATFTLKVQEKIGITEGIENTVEIDTLKEVEVYVLQAKKEIQEFKKLQEQMTTNDNTIKLNEDNRAAAENIRIEAEREREKRFNEIESNSTLLKVTEEVAQARGQSDNLKEELDRREDNVLENINTSWIEHSGISIKAENCYNGRTKDLSIKGMTLQNLSIVGKSHASSGTLYRSIKLTNSGMIKANTTYTLIADLIGSNCGLKDNYDSVLLDTLTAGKNVLKFTTKNNSDYIVFIALSAADIVINDCIILEGDHTANPPISYFEGIKSLGEEEENKISILSAGKNLIDVNKAVYKAIDPNTGAIIDSISKSTILFEDIKVKKGTKFVFSCKDTSKYQVGYYEYDATGNYIAPATLGVSELTSKIDGTFKFRLWKRDDTAITEKDKNGDMYQLEEGTLATAYQSPQSDKKDILLQFEGGLKSLPNGVCDEIKESKIIKKVDNYICTGNENIDINRETELYIRYSINNNVLCNGKDTVVPICNNFPSNRDTSDRETILFYTKYGIIVSIAKSKLITTDVAGFKAWLKANKTEILYELAEPVEYDLKEDINLETFKDITHVSSLNKISGTIKAKFPTNLPATISRLNKENEELENKNKKLQEDTKDIASIMLQVLEPMLLPADEDNRYVDAMIKLKDIILK